MTKNKLYTIIFFLLITLIILVGVVSMLSSSFKSDQPPQQASVVVPTSNYSSPSLVPSIIPSTLPSDSISPTSSRFAEILKFDYPLKYESLIIDYLPKTRHFIIYYSNTRAEAEELLTKFLDEYKTPKEEISDIKIEYIGLTRDPNEPIPGSLSSQ